MIVIQLARLSGFNPIITTASKSNADYLAALGATHILDRSLSPEAIRTEVSKITSAPIEAIYDAVSFPETQNLAYDILAPGGCLIIDYQLAIDEARKTSDKRVEYVYGIVHAPAARTLGASLFAKLSHLLIEGAIRVGVAVPHNSVHPTDVCLSSAAQPCRDAAEWIGGHHKWSGETSKRCKQCEAYCASAGNIVTASTLYRVNHAAQSITKKQLLLYETILYHTKTAANVICYVIRTLIL